MDLVRLMPFVVAALISACHASYAPTIEALGSQSGVAGRSSLVIVPSISDREARRLLATLTPHTGASIDHMVVKLYRVTGGPGNEVETFTDAEADVPSAQIYNTITFGNLPHNTRFRVRAFAYEAPGTDPNDQISADNESYVDVLVGTDDRPAMGNLVVTLLDQTFSGEASAAGVAVDAGSIIHSGAPTVQIEPTLTFTNSAVYVGPASQGQTSQLVVDPSGVVFFVDPFKGLVWKVKPGDIPRIFAGSVVAPGGGTSTPGTGTDARFNDPRSVAIGSDGTLFVGDKGCIRKITNPGAVVTNVAGHPTATGDLPAQGAEPVGVGADARFDQIMGLVVDGNGDLIVADSGNNVLRRVTQAGVVSNLTTHGAIAAPRGLARGRDNHFYLADPAGRRIVKVTSSGAISHVAGDGNVGTDDGPAATASFADLGGGGIAFDKAGHLFVTDHPRVRRVAPNGLVATVAGHPMQAGALAGTTFQGPGNYGTARFSGATGLAVSPYGDLFVADFLSNQVFRVYRDVQSSYSVGQNPLNMAFDAAGNPWVVNQGAGTVTKLSPTGTTIGTFPVGDGPSSIAFDQAGNAWVTNAGADTVTKLSSGGAVLWTRPAGNHPWQIAIDAWGNGWVVPNHPEFVPPPYPSAAVIKLSPAGDTVATYPIANQPIDIAIDQSDTAWISTRFDSAVIKFATSGTVLGTYPQAGMCMSLAVAPDGDVWVVDQAGDRVSKLSASGAPLETFAVGDSPSGIAIAPQGILWVSHVVPDGSANVTKLSATGAVLRFFVTGGDGLHNAVVDAAGNGWFPDSNGDRVFKLED